MYSDEELVSGIIRNDDAAFRAFYERYNSRIYNLCLSYLQNAHDAEEITQDVFVEVFQSIGKFKGQSSIHTWAYRIAINKSLDKIRYGNRQKRAGFLASLFHKDTGELVIDPPEFHHPGVAAEEKEKAAILFSAIKKLPENQQTAFILRQVEGLSQREICQVMDMGEKAVESLIQRAKVSLRKMLGTYYEQNEGK